MPDGRVPHRSDHYFDTCHGPIVLTVGTCLLWADASLRSFGERGDWRGSRRCSARKRLAGTSERPLETPVRLWSCFIHERVKEAQRTLVGLCPLDVRLVSAETPRPSVTLLRAASPPFRSGCAMAADCGLPGAVRRDRRTPWRTKQQNSATVSAG